MPTARQVLVVDDDRDFADGLAAVLELHGYEVHTASDIASAESVAKSETPHIAILDICLGAENGIDLLQRLLAQNSGLICIMATAHAEIDTAIRAVKGGAYDYLRKPLHAEEVLAALGRCDEALRLREEAARAEASAKRERALLFDAVESIAEGFALFDSSDRLVLHNNRLEDMLAHIADQMVPGTRFEDLVRASVRRGGVRGAEGRIEEYVQERLERHRNPGVPFDLESETGRLLRIEERATAEGGRFAIYTDMTARRHAEQALEESEDRFRDMVANVPGVVFQMDMSADGQPQFNYISPSATGLLGLDPESVLADHTKLFDLVHPDDRSGFRESLVRAAREMMPWSWEGRMVLGSGSVWWCQGAARPKRLPAGATLWNGIILDVTERKELEEQLLQSQRLKVVGQMSGGIAHDFNNLMLSAMLNIETAREQDALADEAATCLERALASLASAKELTQRLLAFSRQQPLDPRPTDVNELMGDVTPLIRRTSGGDITIAEKLATDLGNALVDPRQLENAMINLTLNARDAMPGGGTLTIETRNAEIDQDLAGPLGDVAPGEYVMIRVSDTGSGMEPEVVERAFEPFFTTKEVGEGSGLGLSMVYGFLKQSNGHVTLESAPGEGTTVTLYLPTTKEARKEPATEKSPDGEQQMPQGNETIMVVEDEPSVRAVVVKLLTRLGYRIIEAQDGIEALERLDEAGAIDLLFTDIVLPGGLTGKDIAAEVLRRQPDVRLLYTSGYAGNTFSEGEQLPADRAFLSKPYPMKQLANRIREILDNVTG